MKAERRRELKHNSLIWTLQGIPDQIKKYQSQISLALVLIALGIVLIRYRINAREQRLVDAQAAMAIATEDADRLKGSHLSPGNDPLLLIREREEAYSDGLQQADTVLEKAPDSEKAMKAQALLTKGDLNFEMANLPDLPGADTQPSLRPQESEDSLLSGASDAYTQVIQNYPDQHFAVVAAHFGLAAVAENRGQWDDAKAQYQAILDGDAEQAFKDIATQRLGILPELQRPVMIDLPSAVPPASATTQPTTKPQTLGPPSTRK
jgi:tetratricopeptide (TPR) repeat protein